MANIRKTERNDIIMSESRDFKGVWIPKKLYMSRQVTLSEKFLLIEIYTLSKKHVCYASNKHFADFTGLKENTVQKSLLGFEEKGYIERHYEYKNNTKEIKCRKLILTQKFYDDFINETDVVDFNPRGDGLKVGDKYNNISNTYNSATPSHERDFSLDVVKKAEETISDSCLVDAVKYYLEKYKLEMCISHPNISYASLSNFVKVVYEQFDGDIDCLCDGGMIEMIDRHFETNYGQPIDYHFQHFATPGIILYQARNCGLIEGYRD